MIIQLLLKLVAKDEHFSHFFSWVFIFHLTMRYKCVEKTADSLKKRIRAPLIDTFFGSLGDANVLPLYVDWYVIIIYIHFVRLLFVFNCLILILLQHSYILSNRCNVLNLSDIYVLWKTSVQLYFGLLDLSDLFS